MDFFKHFFPGGRLPRLCPRKLQFQGTELSALCACVDAHLALSDARKALSKAEEVAWLHRPFLGSRIPWVNLAIREWLPTQLKCGEYIINHEKDLYLTTSIMEGSKGFFRGLSG